MPSPAGIQPVANGPIYWGCDDGTCDIALNKGDTKGDHRRSTIRTTSESARRRAAAIWGPSSRHPSIVLHGFGDAHSEAVNEQDRQERVSANDHPRGSRSRLDAAVSDDVELDLKLAPPRQSNLPRRFFCGGVDALVSSRCNDNEQLATDSRLSTAYDYRLRPRPSFAMMYNSPHAAVAELADAHGSGPCPRKWVGVQLPPAALCSGDCGLRIADCGLQNSMDRALAIRNLQSAIRNLQSCCVLRFLAALLLSAAAIRWRPIAAEHSVHHER